MTTYTEQYTPLLPPHPKRLALRMAPIRPLVVTGALLDYALANHNVDVDRMYIGGFSSGSLESWAIAKG